MSVPTTTRDDGGTYTPRAPSEYEKGLMRRLMTLSKNEIQDAESKIAKCQVVTLDEFGSIGFLPIASEKLSPIGLPSVSAYAFDEDTVPGKGPYICYILFVNDDAFSELQVFKEDGSRIISLPNPDELFDFEGKGDTSF